nr:hypothetical protein [Tanacetum cinerariifolium]
MHKGTQTFNVPIGGVGRRGFGNGGGRYDDAEGDEVTLVVAEEKPGRLHPHTCVSDGAKMLGFSCLNGKDPEE